MGIQNVLGVNYPYPDEGDKPWGVEHIDWATAVSDATNTLQADVDNINNVEIPNLQAQINLSGEANTSSNQGAGEGLALPKVGVDLPFKTLVAGTGIGISSAADTLTINASSTGDVTGPVAAVDGNVATFNGVTGKIIKMSGVNIDASDNVVIPGQVSAASTDAATANTFWDTVQRPDSSSPGVRGIAISSASGSVTESTTTDQSLGISVTLVTTGRPIFVGCTSGSTLGYFQIDTGTSTNPMDGRIKIKRDGSTEVLDSSFGCPIAGGNDLNKIPPSTIWGIDTPSAGTYTYTVTIAVVNTGTSANISANNVVLIAYEL